MAVDLGIDLGTSTTLICDENGEVLLNEPSLVIKSNRQNALGFFGNYADTRRSYNRI